MSNITTFFTEEHAVAYDNTVLDDFDQKNEDLRLLFTIFFSW